MCLCFGCGSVDGVGGEWVGSLVHGLGGWSGVMYVCAVSLVSLCLWQVQVSLYCVRWIPAHLRCTQCSIMLHLIDICFLTCLCVVVGPGFVSTSPTFMRSIASHPIGPPLVVGGRGRHNWHRVCQTAVTAPPRVGCIMQYKI